ncbi:ParB-like nuclease domain-containing protein [Rhizobium etli 8C-3]|uniref:ParB-like nuclease domain-containing protein n=1 Tax=Rhizobium etli 8C-3 TaxID=538025 RepID=A0A1L5P7I1_RHIET|nr:ParB N-terminal domain-containing protein [Rhizobium etli]APO76076.1 ParB-like nuclease domain-containing protein [Rhizobium etli 8C-3]
MAEFKLIPISEIVVPERLRAVEEEHALAIAQSIIEHGLINPITVRHTPAAKKGNWTLVAGAHRLRAFELNGEPEIEAMVVEGDKAEAQLIEITENLFRNELSVMDRAVFVQSYRDVWESKHGKVEAGRPGNRANLAQLIQDETESGSFNQHVADRMGLSTRAIKRLSQISQHLHPALRSKLRGTPAADNQSLLLKIAKEGPTVQAGFAAALDHEPDIVKVMTLAKPAPKPASDEDRKLAAKADLQAAWKKADPDTRKWFIFDALIELGLDHKLTDKVAAAVRGLKDEA